MSTFQVDQLDHVDDSIYFSDPYGHQFEVTTYDHEEVETGLVVLRGQLHSNAH